MNYNNNRFLQKMASFMYGRYGSDDLNKALYLVGFIIMILAKFLSRVYYIYYLGLALVIWGIYRSFSRNIYKRQRENAFYLQKTRGLRSKLQKRKIEKEQKRSQKKSNHSQASPGYTFVTCGCCRQKLRVKAVSGTIEVTCPNCKARTRVKL